MNRIWLITCVFLVFLRFYINFEVIRTNTDLILLHMLPSWSTVDQLWWMFSSRFKLLINSWSTQSNILPYTVNIIDNCWSTSWVSVYSTCWSTVDQLFLLDFNFVDQQLSNLLLQFQLVEQLLINLLKPNTVGFNKLINSWATWINLSHQKNNLLLNSWSTSAPKSICWSTVDQLLTFQKLANSCSTFAGPP